MNKNNIMINFNKKDQIKPSEIACKFMSIKNSNFKINGNKINNENSLIFKIY